MFSIRCARFVRPAILSAATLGLSVATQAATLTGSAGGSYGSGNSGVGSDLVTGVNLANVGSTGLHGLTHAHGINGYADVSVHGVGATNLTNGFGSFGASSSFNGFTHVNPNTSSAYNYYVGGTGSVSLNDTLTITPTVAYPLNTQVTVTFSIQTFFAGSHSATVNTSQNKGYYLAYVGGGASPVFSFTPTAGNPPSSFYMDSNDNKIFDSSYAPDGSLALGIFAPGSHHVDFTITAQVGRPINFSINARADVNGNLGAGGNPFTGQGASADALLGLAFGATAVAPISALGLDSFTTLSNNLVITSQQFGDFPLASNANANTAYQAAGIPEPASLALLLVSGITLLRRRRA